MVRNGRLLQPEQARQFLDVALALRQQTHDLETAFVGHRLEEGEQCLGHGATPVTPI
jgi:hypothetical protein